MTAPIRFVWHMFLWVIVLLAFHFLLITVLIYGIRIMSTDEICLTKILLVIRGPFALALWWIVVRRISHHYRAKCLIARKSRSRDKYTDDELRVLEQVGKPRHIRNFVVLIISLSGSIYAATLFQSKGDMQFFFGVLVGISSPVIIVAVYKAVSGM